MRDQHDVLGLFTAPCSDLLRTTGPTSAYPGRSPRLWLFGASLSWWHPVWAPPQARANQWLSRSDHPFCVAGDTCSPPGFLGVMPVYISRSRPHILCHFWPSRSALWLVHTDDGSHTGSLALVLATRLVATPPWAGSLTPFHPARAD